MEKMKKTMALLLSYVLVLAILPMGTLVDVVKGATEIPQYLNYGGNNSLSSPYSVSATLYKDKVVFVDNVRRENPNYGNKDSYGNYDYSKYIYQDVLKLIDSGEEKEILDIDKYISGNLNRLGDKAYFNIGGSREEKLIYDFETGKVEKIKEKVLSKNEILEMLDEKLGITYKEDDINFYLNVEDLFDNKGNRVKQYDVQIVNHGSYDADIYNIIENNGEYFVNKSNNYSNHYTYNDGLVYKYDYNYDNKGANNLVTIIDKAEVIGEYPVVGQDVNQWGNNVIGNKLYSYEYGKIFEYELQDDKFVSSDVYDIYGNSATMDSNNNIWALLDENGKRFVVKVKNGELKKMYEVSPVMDRLYVYDDDNLLVASRWGYTHITKKSTSDNNNNGGNDNTTEDKNEVVIKPEVNETVDGTTKVEVGTLTSGATNVIEATVGNNVDKVEVTLTDVETIKNGEGAVTVKLNDGNKINLPFSILSDEMLDGAKEVKVEFTAKEDKKITSGLKAVNKVFSFELLVTKEEGQVSIHNFADGEVEVTLALTDEDLKGLDRSKLVVLYYNEETKEYEEMKTVVDGNNVTFKTPHFSKFIVAEKEIISDSESNEEEGTVGNGSGSIGSGSNNNGSTGTTTGTTNTGSTTTTTNKKPATTSNKLVATGTVASTSVLTMLGLILSGVGATLFVRRK